MKSIVEDATLGVTAAASEMAKPVALSARPQHQKNHKKVAAGRAGVAARKAKQEKILAVLREVSLSGVAELMYAGTRGSWSAST